MFFFLLYDDGDGDVYMYQYSMLVHVCQTGMPTDLATRTHVGKALVVAMESALKCNGRRSSYFRALEVGMPCPAGSEESGKSGVACDVASEGRC